MRARIEAQRVRFAIRTMRDYEDIEPRLAENSRGRIAPPKTRKKRRLFRNKSHNGCPGPQTGEDLTVFFSGYRIWAELPVQDRC